MRGTKRGLKGLTFSQWNILLECFENRFLPGGLQETASMPFPSAVSACWLQKELLTNASPPDWVILYSVYHPLRRKVSERVLP